MSRTPWIMHTPSIGFYWTEIGTYVRSSFEGDVDVVFYPANEGGLTRILKFTEFEINNYLFAHGPFEDHVDDLVETHLLDSNPNATRPLLRLLAASTIPAMTRRDIMQRRIPTSVIDRAILLGQVVGQGKSCGDGEVIMITETGMRAGIKNAVA